MATPVALAEAAYDAGLRSPVPLAQATAIALAETGGNESARNRLNDAWGAWQIRMAGALGEQRRAQHGLASNEALLDLATNARVMAAMSGNGTNWADWSATFGKTRYLLLYPGAQLVAASVLARRVPGEAAQVITEPVDDALDAARTAVASTKKLGAWLSDRNNWTRVAKVVAGVILIGAGVAGATRPMTDAAVTKILKPVKGIL